MSNQFGTHRELEERRRYPDPTACEGRMRVIGEARGTVWELSCEQCGFSAGLPVREADPERWNAHLLTHRRGRSGMPDGLRGLALDDDGGRRSLAMRDWANARLSGVLLVGPVGVGKTHLAAGAAWARMAHGPLRWFATPVLFARLGLGFDDQRRHDALRVLEGGETLVLDDIDKARPTEFAAEQLFCAIDSRVTSAGGLLVTTNLPLRELAARFPEPYGEATASRLAGYCRTFLMEGEDRRLEATAGIEGEGAR